MLMSLSILDYTVKFPWHSETSIGPRRHTTRDCCPRLGSPIRHLDISVQAQPNPHLMLQNFRCRPRMQKAICFRPMNFHRRYLIRCPNGSQVRPQQVSHPARAPAGGTTEWTIGVLLSTAPQIHSYWTQNYSFSLEE